jgi:pSer/pThr/pTyr-binding forkhead associated (FHA) protein
MDIKLVVFKETGEQKVFPIGSGKTIIGRKEDCDLRIPLGEISRKHAVLLVEDDAVVLRDLGSANGTYINNRRITEQELFAGDHVVVGPVVFTVVIDGEPADVRPVKTQLTRTAPVEGSVAGQSALPRAGAVEAEPALDEDEEDPISALEALAGTDDTTAMDVNDSFLGPDDSQN